MNILQDLINAGKGAVRAAGAPAHMAEQIGQHVAQEMAGGGVAGGMPHFGGGGPAQHAAQPMHPMLAAMAFKEALGPDGQPNGTYPGAGPNTTKIPYANGFYAGGYDPNKMLPGQMRPQQPQGIPLLAQMAQIGAPAGQMPQGGQFNPGMVPLQNGGQGGPGYGANLQPAMQTYWQNTDGQRRNMYNPQVNDNGYFYDN